MPTDTQPNDSRRIVGGAGDPACPQCHGLGYLRDDLPPGHPNFGKIHPCACRLENIQLQRAAQLREDSNTETLAGKTFESFLPEGISPDPAVRATLRAAFERCRAFAERPALWLLFSGVYGCGKTHLAAAIANYCLAQGRPVLFLNTPDLLDYLRAAFAPHAETSYTERFEEIRTAPLLILDDLGTESPTPWATEKLYQILNYRYNARLPTVITTNKDLKDIDQRIASRLSDAEIVSVLNIQAPDFRAGKLNLGAEVSTLAIHCRQTFESFDQRTDERLPPEEHRLFLYALRAARAFAENPAGWFVLVGPYGAGKTHLAAAIANHRTQLGKPAIFITYAELAELFRSTGNRELDERNNKLLQQIKNVEFLVLDDLPGLTDTSGYYRERFFQIFNFRFDARLPMVITTAVDKDKLDPRLQSRLLNSSVCQLHMLQVPPYRGHKRAGRKK